MSKIKIYLELSEDIEALLADNKISIVDILENENIDAEITADIAPYQLEEGARSKDLVTIIFAGSAAVLSISFAISQVLNTLYNKPHFIEIYENEELKDLDGNIHINEDGKPLLKPIKRYKLIGPRPKQKIQELEFSFGLKNGIVIKVKSEEKETDKN